MSKLQEIKREYADVLSKQAEVSDVFTGNTDDFIWLISQLEQVQTENEQLKADKQKLVEALELIREDSKEDGIHYKLDRCYATAYHTLRELGEVKGNG